MENGSTDGEWVLAAKYFAGIVLLLVGIFQILQGFIALSHSSFYVAEPNYAFNFDVIGWGWVHLLIGILVLATGFYLFFDAPLARVVGIVAAALSAVSNFLFIPYYPVWAVLIIALDMAVIWTLAVYGRGAEA